MVFGRCLLEQLITISHGSKINIYIYLLCKYIYIPSDGFSLGTENVQTFTIISISYHRTDFIKKIPGRGALWPWLNLIFLVFSVWLLTVWYTLKIIINGNAIDDHIGIVRATRGRSFQSVSRPGNDVERRSRPFPPVARANVLRSAFYGHVNGAYILNGSIGRTRFASFPSLPPPPT